MKHIAIFLSLFLTSFGVLAQNESVIPYFRASEFSGKVFLEWEIQQGNTCNGIDILRSTDSLNFQWIGDIEGICGSTEESVRYTFTDNSPLLNSINYYRLNLGGVGFSWIINLEVIHLGAGNYALFPNPVVSTSELHFDNDQGKKVTLSIIDFSGKEVQSYETEGEFFTIASNEFEQGKYLFEIRDKESSEQMVQGTFVIN